MMNSDATPAKCEEIQGSKKKIKRKMKVGWQVEYGSK